MNILDRAAIVDAIVNQLHKEAVAGLGATPPPALILEIGRAMVVPLARDIVASGVKCLVVEGGLAIMCLRCGRVSHNPGDIQHRYCGNCEVFHERAAVSHGG